MGSLHPSYTVNVVSGVGSRSPLPPAKGFGLSTPKNFEITFICQSIHFRTLWLQKRLWHQCQLVSNSLPCDTTACPMYCHPREASTDCSPASDNSIHKSF